MDTKKPVKRLVPSYVTTKSTLKNFTDSPQMCWMAVGSARDHSRRQKPYTVFKPWWGGRRSFLLQKNKDSGIFIQMYKIWYYSQILEIKVTFKNCSHIEHRTKYILMHSYATPEYEGPNAINHMLMCHNSPVQTSHSHTLKPTCKHLVT